MANPAIRIYESLHLSLGEENAKKFIQGLDEQTMEKIQVMIQHLATKQELNDAVVKLTRTIYIVGLVQLIAIVASVVAIVKSFI